VKPPRARSRAPADPSRRGAVARPALTLAGVLLLLAVFLALQYRHAAHAAFYGDDLLFLDKTRHASFPSLWTLRNLAFGYYRPWGREFHFWALQQLFGANGLAFHLANLALWLTALGLYFAFVRRCAGAASAAIATAGAAALSGWAVPLIWACGSQDLWMQVFALAALLAWSAGRAGWAAAFYAGAVLSKETAAPLPLLALAWSVLVERRPWRGALRRTIPLWAVALAWAAIHPLLAGRFLHPTLVVVGHWPAPPVPLKLLRSVLSVLNLDRWPQPALPWPETIVMALPGALVLVLLVVWPMLARPRGDAGRGIEPASAFPARRLALFGAAWAVLGWVPLLPSFVVWYAYFALFGALGAWLALALWLRRVPWLAAALVAGLVWLRIALQVSPSPALGTEWVQRRAAAFAEHTREYLRGRHPAFPPHSRAYLANVPGTVELTPGDGESPLLRVWYADTTLKTWYLSRYTPRAATAPARDYFFFWDSLAGWREVMAGPEPSSPGSQADPFWRRDHVDLALVMTNARDWRGAAVEWEKLAVAFPERPDYAYDLAVCLEQLGDSVAAATWYQRAAERPGATEQILAAARRTRRLLRR
jgi:hypothetical protein